MAVIVLLPVLRNVYSLIKYKMSFSAHDKQIIEAFCENASCVYVSKLRIVLYIAAAFFMPTCIFYMHYFLFFGNKKYVILSCIVNIILHILAILAYAKCLYAKFVITNTAMLIRSVSTKFLFVIVQLNDIMQYKQFSYLDSPFWFVDGDKSLAITTKDNRRFILLDIKNRDEFISALKMFTGSVEIRKK